MRFALHEALMIRGCLNFSVAPAGVSAIGAARTSPAAEAAAVAVEAAAVAGDATAGAAAAA